jgi:hypothetical protein
MTFIIKNTHPSILHTTIALHTSSTHRIHGWIHRTDVHKDVPRKKQCSASACRKQCTCNASVYHKQYSASACRKQFSACACRCKIFSSDRHGGVVGALKTGSEFAPSPQTPKPIGTRACRPLRQQYRRERRRIVNNEILNLKTEPTRPALQPADNGARRQHRAAY